MKYPVIAKLRRDSDRHTRRVTATSAAKNFGRLVDLVRETRAEYIVERDGRPVVRVGPAGTDEYRVRDLVDLLRALPKPTAEFRRTVAEARTAGNRPVVPRSAWE